VTASAGYGKSILVSCWLGACGLPSAWLSLDTTDNDLHLFLSYLLTAVQTVSLAVGKKSRPFWIRRLCWFWPAYWTRFTICTCHCYRSSAWIRSKAVIQTEFFINQINIWLSWPIGTRPAFLCHHSDQSGFIQGAGH
jgi:hypothetical protein